MVVTVERVRREIAGEALDVPEGRIAAEELCCIERIESLSDQVRRTVGGCAGENPRVRLEVQNLPDRLDDRDSLARPGPTNPSCQYPSTAEALARLTAQR